ncbi:MAG: tRNA (adenosine(37)-N6)-threonylcarbamoyltransferase complex dimerization subunit type 1 TsaB [Candidatus Omnitrophica bacterium]|nr:tRNA (adenosine(37)-N6)-threonylcarbamoyltransferase complex dimerization subunit type 1 TsaB [Candidatus Omnitrophota bacterium]
MKLLAMDTSSPVLSAGIFEGEDPVLQFESEGFLKHSSALLPVIDRLFKKSGLKPAQVDGLAVGLGPGSFTGLRVGVTVTKVLGYALRKKVVGVSSLEAMAYAVKDFEGKIAVVLDAKRGNLYAALYEKKGKEARVFRKPRLYRAEGFVRQLSGASLCVGDVAIQGFAGKWVCAFPTAHGVVRAAMTRIRKKNFSAVETLEPLYLYPRDCHVIRK